jgi:CRP-like cAMP-binding protein
LTRNNRGFDSRKFLTTIGKEQKVVTFHKAQTIFTQGDAAGAVFYIREGKVIAGGLQVHGSLLNVVLHG